ncbi:MAG: DUF4428 domain-containing protein [Oscillospiraceae bacterium]|nr:DUF4428 domain-containing protein [Oscillospiraceae bacterium]
MGLFDIFKKQDCEICGKEVGMFGYKKLEDGEICKDCVKLLSPWFEDRRHATVAQIKEQIAYRERNAKELEGFTVSRVIGEAYKMYIEEVNGVPVRFFVTDASDYKAANPDIISFKDVMSCVTDIEVRDEEMKQRDAEGKMVSYDPPRYKQHHNFYIKMQIRNNPYFDDIKFYVNRGVVTLETIGGFGAGVASSFLRGAGVSNARFSTGSFRDAQEQRKFNEYQQMCQIIEQAVEDGKRGAAAPVRQSSAVDPVSALIEQIRNAPDLATVTRLQQTVTMMIMNDPNKERLMSQISSAIADARVRIETQMAVAAFSAPAQETPKPKFCPNCGAPYEGGKFCQSCGSKL